MTVDKPKPIKQLKPERLNIDQRIARFKRKQQSTGVDWSKVSALSLRVALHATLAEGGALMFSSAAGGLGVCVTVFLDGDRTKEYVMEASHLTGFLDTLGEAFGSESEDLRVAMATGTD